MSEFDELLIFLKEVERNPESVSTTIIFNRVKKHVGKFSTKEFAWVLSKIIIRSDLQSLLMKARADTGDTLAAEELDIQINGDPLSKQESKRMGLMGLFIIEKNQIAGELLVQLGAISQDEYNKALIPSTLSRAGTMAQQLASAAAEAKTFSSYSDYLMSVYSDTLEEVDRPTLKNLTYLMGGKYSSVEDFYHAARKGELDIKKEPKIEPKIEPKVEPKIEPTVEPKIEPKVEPKIESIKKEIESIKKEIEAKISKKTEQASLFGFNGKKKAPITKKIKKNRR